MRFTKRDEASKLIGIIHDEQKELANLQKRFDVIRLEWFKLDMACAKIAALLAGQAGAYTRGSEPLFHEHSQALMREMQVRIAKRDSLLGTVPADIQALKDKIARRLSHVSGAFSSFAGVVLGHHLNGGSRLQCSETLQAQLQSACREAAEMTDPERLIEFITRWTERIENEDDIRCPLLRLDVAVQKALNIGPEVTT